MKVSISTFSISNSFNLDCISSRALRVNVIARILFCSIDLNLDRNLGLQNPLNEKDLNEFIHLYENKKESPNSWFKDYEDINKDNWDLTVINPNQKEEIDDRSPEDIFSEIEELDKQSTEVLKKIKELL